MTVALEPVDDTDLGYVLAVLREADLPSAGIGDDTVRLFLAEADGDRVGVGGFEDYGEVGLLRSIAIEPGARDQGYGTALVDAVETEAQAAGIETLVLLTTDAGPFFETLGYTPADWSSVPESSALSAVCPDSATCLSKRL